MREIWFFLLFVAKNKKKLLDRVFFCLLCLLCLFLLSKKDTLEFFLSFFLDFASFFTHKKVTLVVLLLLLVIVVVVFKKDDAVYDDDDVHCEDASSTPRR